MVSDNCGMAHLLVATVFKSYFSNGRDDRIKLLQICKDIVIAFQAVINMRYKMEGISNQRKYYGWKYKFQESFKTKVRYITPCKL